MAHETQANETGERCEKCGFSDPRALHRHHARNKEKQVSETVVLCANCHYILHSTETAEEVAERRRGGETDYEKENAERRFRLKGELKLLKHITKRLEELGVTCTIKIDPEDSGIYPRVPGLTEEEYEKRGWRGLLNTILNELSVYGGVEEGVFGRERVKYACETRSEAGTSYAGDPEMLDKAFPSWRRNGGGRPPQPPQ